ncbi:hypothetical protein [Halorientalis salina]|uniref:hypothetical protein n=1 Tax=Halorientalis salina TaxID=2932266 RepID=UPI0010ABB914|nr:hypothetical protein [Halorientalis salina]
MPTCPGCCERVPHVKLPVHEQFCESVVGEAPTGPSVYEYFDARIQNVERRLETRISLLEASVSSSADETAPYSPDPR